MSVCLMVINNDWDIVLFFVKIGGGGIESFVFKPQ